MRYLGILFLLFASLQLSAQEKCGIEAYEQILLQRNPNRLKPAAFEKWVTQKKAEFAKRPAALRTNHVVIPVVVHVVHLPTDNTIGSRTNISDAQILEQIEILNQDFRKLNTAQIEALPEDFKNLAADTHIEFVLAKQDPEGLPTTGIVRVEAKRNSYSMSFDLELKSLSQWPSDQYLNIYSAPLEGTLLGYAQLPESDILEGLDELAGEESDGVVITYDFFGKGGSAAEASLGRTLTHEVGHYFGLRHIWGDGSCNEDDFVEDTPPVEAAHYNCPSSPNAYLACDNNPAMYQNYMDYTEDKCMALFTLGQAARMEVILNNSPRRKELNNSPGKVEPQRLANDVGIRSVEILDAEICQGIIDPKIEIRNYGSNSVNQLRIQVYLDNKLITSLNPEVLLDYPEITFIDLGVVTNLSPGNHELKIVVDQVNGQTDPQANNNILIKNISVPQQANLPYLETFNQGDFGKLISENPDELIGWEIATVERAGNTENKAAFLNFFNYTTETAFDYLVSPLYDLSNSQVAFANFDVAFAQYSGSGDGLNVYIVTNCAGSTEDADLIYSKKGSTLATATVSGNKLFIPEDESAWRTEFVDLTNYLGYSQVRLIFEGINDYGNALYLDNIRVSTSTDDVSDVALVNIVEPSPVQADTTGFIRVAVLNATDEEINSLQVNYKYLNNNQSYILSSLAIPANQTDTIVIGQYNRLLAGGTYNFEVSVTKPNGKADLLSYNNQRKREVTINQQKEIIPLRLSVNKTALGYQTLWANVSDPPQQVIWNNTAVVGPVGRAAKEEDENYGLEAYFESNKTNNSAWLVSPILDLQYKSAAGMEFYYSYSAKNTNYAKLYILASTNGGRLYTDTLWQAANGELSTRTGDSSIPLAADDWNKDFVSLFEYLGQDSLRIAFVAEGNNRAQVFLDEIQFYELNAPPNYQLPNPNSFAVFPNPISKTGDVILSTAFNFSQRQNVLVQVIDTKGKTVFSTIWENVLNTPIPLDVSKLSPGIYAVRIRNQNFAQTRKVLVSP